MRILLIYPYFIEERVHTEEVAAVPMGLYYIGAMLKDHGHEVEILNWHDAKDAREQIEQALNAKRPDVIGFSILHANRWGGIDIARIAKAADPGVKVVFGGIGAAFLWQHLLTHFDQIDYIVMGEGEFTFLRLLQVLQGEGGSDSAAEIPGLALRQGGKAVQTPPSAPIRNLDDLPPPARYFDFQHLSLTRGCPGRCTFCGSPQFWGRRVRAHSADYFVDQMAMLAQRGINFFYVSDDTFTLDARRVVAVCRKIVERGLKVTWQAISKVSAVNEEMLYWMRKAGCVQLSFGVESGAPEIRRLLCKDIEASQIERAFKLTVAHGILARAYFIYGAPGETWETIEQSLDLIKRIQPLAAIFYILDIFPGTALYEQYKARTGVTDDIWLQRKEDILYFESDDALDQDTILAFGRRLRESFHRWLPQFAHEIELKDDASLLAEQADFLSRLGLTFSHGDYAGIQGDTPAHQVAMELFRRALGLHPDHRAFWGLALIQQHLNLDAAIEILQRGLRHHPKSQPLNICIGVGYASQGRYDQALAHLLPFDASPDAVPHIIRCHKALGNADAVRAYEARQAQRP